MILLPLGITNKFVLLSLTRKIHRLVDSSKKISRLRDFFYKTFGGSKKCITFAVANQAIASWCNGSTTDFGSACRGSNPREATYRGVEQW